MEQMINVSEDELNGFLSQTITKTFKRQETVSRQNMYARTLKQRYDSITDVFPNIHNRVPQHMIDSYLGITPVHLSRLKKTEPEKV